jgi:hypothetical protein
MAYKTIYNPVNAKKYIGNTHKIVCRSLWERNVCKFLDENESIIKWSSEEIAIPYTHPIDNKIHHYYPDFMVQFKNESGLQTWLLEVKPKKQTMLREHATKSEKLRWMVNRAKWNAAKQYCDKNNITFKILTEQELFTNGNK